MKKEFSILIGGQAGQGSRFAGLIIAKIFGRLGYRIYIYEDYQSLIRGGHNFSQIRASEKEFQSRKEKIDFLLALDKNTLDLHKKDLDQNGLIVFNSDKIESKEGIGVPIEKITKEMGGIPIMANTALISAFSKIVGIDFEILKEVLTQEIKKSIDLNLKIAKKAFEESKILLKIKKLEQKPKILLTGNEGIASGMAKAGLKFYFGYPMTPATSIMNFLVSRENLNVKVIQPENEISVINMALGASFAGKRSAVGTSGGGFALMVEALSLAGQSETPILIVESQRGAPSTGMPTYNLQGDLLFVLSAGHGDFPRFVIAPGDAEQCFYYAGLGLNLAWKYQTPVILLVDKDVSENTFSVDEKIANFDEFRPIFWDKKGEYKRYKITENGISLLTFPGEKNAIVKANSYEHDEFGISNDEEEMVERMQEKRLRKYRKMAEEVESLPAIKVYGNEKSEVAIISWGISKGAAKEVAENLGIKLIQPIIIEPFPEKQMEEALRGVKKIFLVELNSTGQMAKILNQNEIKVDGKILKYNGRPFWAREIEEKLKGIL
ncbi:MAG: pyruvate ferredoxin oxidoreductase [Candidatus Nealsonbacteria bacterium CG_4_9_14_0_8_um_filter_35_12]|uniref:Pyruvate ferredoxin oxidoreductase n=1 Tax=Candidatus Nealsonbacteria bacterium CG_4_9_14_0_8_um_filter_35_12 TaxID=1974692 RepID=A0A2M8DM78_9BACT|nr:MAG: pyruvate ferredoxin oxidoreductase [Candidatus Nealsonbacteria bacterium CG_4_9_14_0_8_um_filter_35_12]